MTFEQAIGQYVEHLRGIGKSPNSVRTYGARLAQFSRFLREAGLTVTSAPYDVLDRFVAWLFQGGPGRKAASVATCYCSIAAVRAFQKWLAKQGQTLNWADAEYPGHETKDVYVPEPEEVAAFLQALAGVEEPYATALYLFPATGLRLEEMCGLPMSAVQVHGAREVDLRVIGKGRKERVVPVLTDAVPRLAQYLRGYRDEVRSSRLFPDPADPTRGLRSQVLKRRLYEVREQIRNPRIAPHRFRAYFATRLAEAGVSELKIAQILGHESLSTTKRYTRPRPRALRDAVRDVRMV